MSIDSQLSIDKTIEQRILPMRLEQKRAMYRLICRREQSGLDQNNARTVLVSCVTLHLECEDEEQCIRKIKDFIGDKLPGYAIPSKIFLIKAIPKLVSGKIDKSTLKSMAVKRLLESGLSESADTESAIAIARDRSINDQSLTRQTIHTVWEHVLGCKVSGVDENFFELGGDSILSIHVVSRLLQAGYSISPNDLFDFPTIALLADKLDRNNDVEVDTLDAVNNAPLTPIQSWFFNTVTADPARWNMARLFQLQQGIEAMMVENALDKLARHHDVFNLSFTPLSSGYCHQLSSQSRLMLETIRLEDQVYSDGELHALIASQSSSFDLNKAPLFRFILFETKTRSILLITAHHLLMDVVSWEILKQDLEYCLSCETSDKALVKSTPFTAWCSYQATLSSDRLLTQQIEFWNQSVRCSDAELPAKFFMPDSESDSITEATIRLHSIQLDEQVSQLLRRDAHANYQTSVIDLVLSALVLTIWQQYGQSQLRIALEGHGRIDPHEQLDLSRTIGWFSTVYPLILSLDPGAGDEDERLASAIKQTKNGIRQIKYSGMGYGLLNQSGQLNSDHHGSESAVLFNYMGHYQDDLTGSASGSVLTELDVETPGLRHPGNQRSHAIEIQAYFKHQRFYLDWFYDKNMIDKTELITFSNCYQDTLHKVLMHCQHNEHGSYTPSDFPDAGLDQQALDDFLDSID